jgi:hypothetical protein
MNFAMLSFAGVRVFLPASAAEGSREYDRDGHWITLGGTLNGAERCESGL